MQDLIDQRDAVDRQIADLREQAAEQARQILAEYALTPEDIFGRGAKRARTANAQHPLAGVKKVPQFRDPDTGTTWSGRGMKPRWLTAHISAGRAIEEFRIPG